MLKIHSISTTAVKLQVDWRSFKPTRFTAGRSNPAADRTAEGRHSEGQMRWKVVSAERLIFNEKYNPKPQQ